MTRPAEYDGLLALALDIAREAGALLLERPGDLGVDTKSTPTDVVTVMDKASEKLIVNRPHAERPWDLSAGGLIAQRAGLTVTGLRGAPAGWDLVVATPSAVEREARRIGRSWRLARPQAKCGMTSRA